MAEIETAQDLDRFYAEEDPWDYQAHPDDQRRLDEVRVMLSGRQFRHALDIGCGNGFITTSLPATNVLGIDLSSSAIDWARKRASRMPDPSRFDFECRSIFDVGALPESHFDLIVITGVLYPQYIGRGYSLARVHIDRILRAGGTLLSCHIDEWMRFRFPYSLVDQSLYPYREYTHRIEVFVK